MAKSEVANLCSRDPTPRSSYEKLKIEEKHRSDGGGR